MMPVYDVAYFISGGLSPSDRRAHEIKLFHTWYFALPHSVRQQTPWQVAMFAYQMTMGYMVLIPVFAAGSACKEEKGRLLLVELIQRSGEALKDWNCTSVWKMLLSEGRGPKQMTVEQALQHLPPQYVRDFEALL